MTVKTEFYGAGIVILLAIGLSSPASVYAQRRGGMGRQMPMYDTNTETTLKGTVEEVKIVSGMMDGGGRMGRGDRSGMPRMGMMQGTHLILKTDSGTIEVHVGPSAFLKEQKIEIAKGDIVEVVGSRITIGESHALLARELRKGETAWTLREANGRPRWMMMGGR